MILVVQRVVMKAVMKDELLGEYSAGVLDRKLVETRVSMLELKQELMLELN